MNIVNRGVIATESEYPYVSGKTGKLTQCSVPGNPVSVDFKGYVNVTQGDEAALTEAIAKQPVISIGIDAHSFEFQLVRLSCFHLSNSFDDLLLLPLLLFVHLLLTTKCSRPAPAV